VEGAIAPAIWFYEVANIATLKLKRGVLTDEQYAVLSEAFAKMRVECDALDLMRQCEAASALARRHNLTVYDAAYLEVALRMKLPLASLDGTLVRAARAAGVQVLP
jgi:predicted nucleic acid-binding protein